MDVAFHFNGKVRGLYPGITIDADAKVDCEAWGKRNGPGRHLGWWLLRRSFAPSMDHCNGLVGPWCTSGNRQIGAKNAVEDVDLSADIHRRRRARDVDVRRDRGIVLVGRDRRPLVERNAQVE